ncbi:hypothetical protein ACLOJK_027740, partial [Asimina triloba]
MNLKIKLNLHVRHAVGEEVVALIWGLWRRGLTLEESHLDERSEEKSCLEDDR